MPWKETNIVDERKAFVLECLKRKEEFSELCDQYEISRKTGYKWLQRFYDGGLSGLVDRSRRPHRIARKVPEEVAEAIVALRKQYPTWGPKKLRKKLSEKQPEIRCPALSTIGDLLKRRGLIPERRRRIRTPHRTQPLAAATAPNTVWTADFKGAYRVAGKYCHPLTIADAHSRYVLKLQPLDAERFALVQPVFEAVFQQYGMPYRIRTDNGSPFASSKAVGGLSRLSVWWVRLGITPERIEPGHPEQNGRHERMHRTMKAEAVHPGRSRAGEQETLLEDFRVYYNGGSQYFTSLCGWNYKIHLFGSRFRGVFESLIEQVLDAIQLIFSENPWAVRQGMQRLDESPIESVTTRRAPRRSN